MHLHAVDERAIGTAPVYDLPTLTLPPDIGVVARSPNVVQDHIAL
jgi:hypothetical protein